ncbi:hypothetical protein LINPERPRIM_LOCUS8606 [Linum perenne]
MSSGQCCRPLAYDQQNCNTTTQHHQGPVPNSTTGYSNQNKTHHHHHHSDSAKTHGGAHNLFGINLGAKPTTTPNGGACATTCQLGAKTHRTSRRKNSSEHKKRGLIQKIKDGISGHSDDSCSSSSSSSSDSESDDDHKKKKNNKRNGHRNQACTTTTTTSCKRID